jgi:psiF repeat-containing protein
MRKMDMKIAISAALLSLAIGTGSVFAQTSAPAPAPAPAAQPAAPAAAPAAGAATDKKAISKACSQQADAKSLKGKDRKKFRSACKKNGGKAPS